jgi:hypothetical protein
MTDQSIPMELTITLLSPAQDAPEGALASFILAYPTQGLIHFGGWLSDPITPREHEELKWYLQEYWEWPFAEFLERGRSIEHKLKEIGQRLFNSVFGTPQATRILAAWDADPLQPRQISLILADEVPAALALPWELLHDEQGFLTLRTRQPVSLIRRLPQTQAALNQPFEHPLRVLLVTARPDNAEFIDPRTITRELFDEVQSQVSTSTTVVTR